MTTQEVANKLHTYCSKGQYKKAWKELYAKNAWSQEPAGVTPRTAKGLTQLAKKADAWTSQAKVYGRKVSKPIIAGNWVSMKMELDMQWPGGPRQKASELCVFEVKEGKIVSEQFFYG